MNLAIVTNSLLFFALGITDGNGYETNLDVIKGTNSPLIVILPMTETEFLGFRIVKQ